MAVDSAAKRASALDACTPIASILPAVDGSIDVGDRLTLVGLYMGLTPQQPAAPARRGRPHGMFGCMGRLGTLLA